MFCVSGKEGRDLTCSLVSGLTLLFLVSIFSPCMPISTTKEKRMLTLVGLWKVSELEETTDCVVQIPPII